MSQSLDELFHHIGLGLWQLPSLVANILLWSVYAVHMIGTTLWNPPTLFKCFTNTNFTLFNQSLTTSGYDSNSSTYFESKCLTNVNDELYSSNLSFDLKLSEMPMLINDTFFSPIVPVNQKSCLYIQYDNSIFWTTITSEWNLVCDKSFERPLFQNIYNIGLVVGCVIGGQIGDSLGRAKAALLGSIVHTASTVTIAFCNNFVVVLIARFAIGIANQCLLVTLVTHALEISPERFRSPIGMMMGVPFALGMIYFAILGYFIRKWRYLYLAISAHATLLIPTLWYMDESPRWLLQKGKTRELIKTLQKAAHQNKCSISRAKMVTIVQDMIKEGDSSEITNVNWISTLKTFVTDISLALKGSALRNVIFVTPFIWLCSEIVYYGIVFNVNVIAKWVGSRSYY